MNNPCNRTLSITLDKEIYHKDKLSIYSSAYAFAPLGTSALLRWTSLLSRVPSKRPVCLGSFDWSVLRFQGSQTTWSATTLTSIFNEICERSKHVLLPILWTPSSRPRTVSSGNFIRPCPSLTLLGHVLLQVTHCLLVLNSNKIRIPCFLFHAPISRISQPITQWLYEHLCCTWILHWTSRHTFTVYTCCRDVCHVPKV